MERVAQLGSEKIRKLIINFSAPAVAGLLVSGLYNIAGGIFVGRGVGSMALSGLSVSFALMIIIMAFGMLSGMGATALTSLKLGEGKNAEAEIVVGNAVTLGIIISVLITVSGIIFLKPILSAFGARNESMKFGYEFSSLLLFGTVFQILTYSLNNLIRGEGNPRMALSTTIIGFLIYCLITPMFIFGFHFGIRGASAGIITAQIFTTIWTLFYFLGKKSTLRLHFKNLKLKMNIVTRILSIGIAPFSMQLISGIILILINHMVGIYGGNTGIAAMGVAFSVYNLFMMPLIGINQGIQPIIGYNYGAKQYKRVKSTLKTAIIAATVFCMAGFLIIINFNVSIMKLFVNDNPSVVIMGAHGLKVFLMMLPVIGFQIISISYFQAVGKPKEAIILSLLKYILLLMPLVIILPLFFKLEGVWLSGPLSDFISAIITIIFLYLEIRHLNRKHSYESSLKKAEVVLE